MLKVQVREKADFHVGKESDEVAGLPEQRNLADNPGRGSLLMPVSHHGFEGFRGRRG